MRRLFHEEERLNARRARPQPILVIPLSLTDTVRARPSRCPAGGHMRCGLLLEDECGAKPDYLEDLPKPGPRGADDDGALFRHFPADLGERLQPGRIQGCTERPFPARLAFCLFTCALRSGFTHGRAAAGLSVGRWCLIGPGGALVARETLEAFGRTTEAKSLFSSFLAALPDAWQSALKPSEFQCT